MYYRETSAFQISLDPDTAVGEYIKRKTVKPAADDAVEEENEAKEDYFYLGKISRLNLPRAAHLDGCFISDRFHPSDSGAIAFTGTSSTMFPEVTIAGEPAEDGIRSLKQVSEFGRAVETWDMGTIETIRWPSKDGTEIEGVLRKPSDFDPERQYPLVFVVHGGPRWFSDESLISYLVHLPYRQRHSRLHR